VQKFQGASSGSHAIPCGKRRNPRTRAPDRSGRDRTKHLLAALPALALIAPARADVANGCAAIARSKIEVTNLLSSTVVPAANGAREYCRVLGFVRAAINFEIHLPTTSWNGKFLMFGCGGFRGSIDTPGQIGGMRSGPRHGYAVSTTDAGHWGASPTDGRWAMDNPVARADWAWRATTATARVSKAVIRQFYGTAARKSYFDGCSNGRAAGVDGGVAVSR
jgi:hypothetical protein